MGVEAQGIHALSRRTTLPAPRCVYQKEVPEPCCLGVFMEVSLRGRDSLYHRFVTELSLQPLPPPRKSVGEAESSSP